MPTPIRSRLLVSLAVLPLAGCSTLGYYAHLAGGETALLAARRPVARVIADPATPATVKTRLELAARARAFASDTLRLPRNASYTSYADLHRDYAVWNVFAAPEFSLEAYRHCFPIAGCVAYRGYYDKTRAEAYAAELRGQGLETYVGGVSAFSTLGFFADPILNTMLRWDDDELAGTIFHELAHQRVYLKGDTEFNESFASFVQREGLRQWRAARGLAPADDVAAAHDEAFEALVLAARARLAALYAEPLPPDAMRVRKAQEFARLRSDYAALRDTQWHGDKSYDGWFAGDLNNAKLLPFGLYRRWTAAFAALFAQCGGDWERFFAAVQTLAHADAAARNAQLDAAAHKEM